MPCDTVQLSQVNLELANHEILDRALKSIADPGSVARAGNGFYFRKDRLAYRINDDGQLICQPGREAMADTIKRAYSREVVNTGARKFGWSVSVKTQDKVLVTRRRG